MPEKYNWVEVFVGMSLTGLIVGFGQALASEEPLTKRIIVGRALSTVGLALVAGLVFLQIPDAPLPVIVGLSALCASLGTSGLERFVQKYFGIEPRK